MKKMIIAAESDFGYCPHCNHLIHAGELVDSNLPNIDAPVHYHAIENEAVYAETELPLLLAEKKTPVVVLGPIVLHSIGDDYDLIQEYLLSLFGINYR